MLRMGAAAAVGAGVSLAAVHYLRSADAGRAAERGPPGEGPRAAESDYWGSPVLPLAEAGEGNKTMSPSKLPRPRKLFSDSEGEGMEVALVDYQLTHMLEKGALRLGSTEIDLGKYVQPASIDLPISGTVYLVKEKVLPFRKQVRELIEELVLEEKELGGNGAVLLKGQTYLFYCGKVRLPEGCRGCLSPKSSIGRVDVMVRGVVDGCGLYDIVPGDGKERELWLEISPRSFNVRVHAGSAMTQLMLFMGADDVLESDIPIVDAQVGLQAPAGVECSTPTRPASPGEAVSSSMAAVNQSFDEGSSIIDEERHEMLEESVDGLGNEQQAWQRELESRICYDTDGTVLPLHLHKGALVLSVCIPTDHALLAGYEAIATEEVIDLTRVGSHDPRKFFRPVYSHGSSVTDARLTLEKDRFYILATKERVSIPVHLSAEMVPFSHHVGELRAHYAGFFDPGFGFGANGDLKGSIGVLEVRPHETINIYHGQPICLMEFFRNASAPKTPYGSGAINSNYQGQSGPKLAKYFGEYSYSTSRPKMS